MAMRFGKYSLLVFAALLFALSVEASEQNIEVQPGRAAIIELAEPVKDMLVANPKIVKAVLRNNKRIFILGEEAGRSNIFFFNKAGKKFLTLNVIVAHDLAALRKTIHEFFPKKEIEVSMMGTNIVLAGKVENATLAAKVQNLAAKLLGDKEKIINMMEITRSEQVMLKVTIAEVERNTIKQLGINLAALGNGKNFIANVITRNSFPIAAQALGGLSIAGTYDTGSEWSLSPTIQALERAGVLKTLAEPNLTTISGEKANFLAGGEFPVPTGSSQAGEVQVSFKPFGVGLSFLPTVLGDGRINIHVSTEVSELSASGAFSLPGGLSVVGANGTISNSVGLTIPAITVRRADTTVALPSGGSLMIAGLLSESTQHNIEGVPGLKDLPILGTLFRSRDFQNNETELVIIITPYIVKPASANKLSKPSDGFIPAGDIAANFWGKLYKTYNPNAANKMKKPNGPLGSIIQ